MAGVVVFLLCVALGTSSFAQSDGNPHKWDRLRRCDWDYDPPCKPCEGIGGLAYGDENSEIALTTCTPLEPGKASDLVKPVWGTNFQLKNGYHEILIGRKKDPFCFQVFPGPNSLGNLCYRREEGTLNYDMEENMAIQLNLNVHIQAFPKNVTSTVIHQHDNMWIVNNLWFGVNQCLCFKAVPDVFKDVFIRPHIAPIQPDWTSPSEYVGRELIYVEYLWKNMSLDHWVLGPHHVWSDIHTGEIVRMWQPFNGLEVLDPSTRSPADKSAFQIPPPQCKKGTWFRINCDDDGFPLPCSNSSTPGYHNAYCNEDNKPSRDEVMRAENKIPGDAFKGKSFPHSASVLNAHIQAKYNTSKACESFTSLELQMLQTVLHLLRHSDFDEVYQRTTDKRMLSVTQLEEVSSTFELTSQIKEWELLNALSAAHPRVYAMYRAGLCAETLMMFVHHLTESAKETFLRDYFSVPLLSHEEHTCPPDANTNERKICAKYHQQVSCATCHTAPENRVPVLSNA